MTCGICIFSDDRDGPRAGSRPVAGGPPAGGSRETGTGLDRSARPSPSSSTQPWRPAALTDAHRARHSSGRRGACTRHLTVFSQFTAFPRFLNSCVCVRCVAVCRVWGWGRGGARGARGAHLSCARMRMCMCMCMCMFCAQSAPVLASSSTAYTSQREQCGGEGKKAPRRPRFIYPSHQPLALPALHHNQRPDTHQRLVLPGLGSVPPTPDTGGKTAASPSSRRGPTPQPPGCVAASDLDQRWRTRLLCARLQVRHSGRARRCGAAAPAVIPVLVDVEVVPRVDLLVRDG